MVCMLVVFNMYTRPYVKKVSDFLLGGGGPPHFGATSLKKVSQPFQELCVVQQRLFFPTIVNATPPAKVRRGKHWR